MAGNIKGITIEIGGDTKPLQNALKGVNKQSAEATKELRQIDRALKFDTGNVTLLTQKQDVLAKQVQTTREKLQTLKQAQAQVEAQFKSGQIGADQYRAFQREVETTKTTLNSYENKLEQVNRALGENGGQVDSNKNKLNALQTEQAQLVSESDKLNSAFKLQESALGSNASESDKLALAQKKVTDQSDILEKQIKNLEQQLELTKSEYGENSVEANKLEQTLNETKTAYNNLQQEMEELSQSADSANTSLSETNQLLKADLLMAFGDKIAELSQKLIEFGKSSLDAFREVDEGMDIIITKTGASGEALDEMVSIAKTLVTELPTDFNTAGSSVGELNTQFGLTGERLKEASSQLIQFAAINGSDVTSSAITAKQAIEAYGLEATDLSSVLDSVTYTSQATGVGVQELMDKVVAGAPQLKALGLSFDEGTALMGKFEKAGVDSSAALSSLSKASVVYAKDGKTLQEGLTGTIEKIKSSTSETEQLSLASEIFGSKAAPRMVDAIKRGALSFEDLSGTAKEATGVVKATYEETLDPIDQFTTAQNTAKLAMAEIGDVIASTLAPIFSVLADLLQSVVTWFSNLSQPIKEFIIIVGGLVVGLGLVLPVVMALQAAAMAFGTSIVGLITASAPIIAMIVGVIAVVGLLVVAIKTLWQENESFRTAVLTIWETISSFLMGVVQGISNFVMSIWGQLTAWWQENQALMLEAARVAWESLQAVISAIMEMIGPYLQAVWDNIVLVLTTAWEVIKLVVETALSIVLGLIKAVMQVITGDWSGAWETIKQVLSTAWEAMKSIVSLVLSAIAQFITNAWNGIKGTITNLLSAISSVVSSSWNSIKSVISGVLSSISSSVSSSWNGIKSTISSVLSGISSTVSSVWNGVRTSITTAINGAKDAVASAINAIKSLFNFQIKWPHIPLPHFRVSGSPNPLDWLKGAIPSFSIEWYAKGGILTKPTVFGMNGNHLMVGGEAGREAVLPLNEQTLGAIGRGIAKTMANQVPPIEIVISGNVVREEADLNRLAEKVGEKLLDELQRQQGLKGVMT